VLVLCQYEHCIFIRVRDLNKQLEALENELQNTEETEDVQV
jgi:hypothetical protein